MRSPFLGTPMSPETKARVDARVAELQQYAMEQVIGRRAEGTALDIVLEAMAEEEPDVSLVSWALSGLLARDELRLSWNESGKRSILAVVEPGGAA